MLLWLLLYSYILYVKMHTEVIWSAQNMILQIAILINTFFFSFIYFIFFFSKISYKYFSLYLFHLHQNFIA